MLPDDEVVDALLGLVDQSLVMTIPSDSLRYRMLEPVRQYASQCLQESGTDAEAHRRNAEHYYRLALAVAPELKGYH
jgi:predicted ATPase